MKTQRPKLSFHLKDGLADVYAFATLYDYLVVNQFQAEFRTHSRYNLGNSFNRIVEECSSVSSPITEMSDINEAFNWSDLILGGHCDIFGHSFGEKTISIDHSILKNCVKPISEEKRNSLRQRYNIPNDKPVVVIGFPKPLGGMYEWHESLERIINHICHDANVYFVGSVNTYFEAIEATPEIFIRKDFGILKDYYAIADVAIIADNANVDASYSSQHMHNFIEATAGGPLFLVKPQNVKQYGYKQLKDLGVIRESANTDDLIDKIKSYLSNDFQNSAGVYLRILRAQHLNNSRKKYLTDLARLFNRVLGTSTKPFESDLSVHFLNSEFPSLRVMHPETNWTNNFGIFNSVPIKDLPNQLIRGFGGE